MSQVDNRSSSAGKRARTDGGMYGMPPMVDRYGLGMPMDHGAMGSKSENSKSSKPKMPEGSWKCEKCNNINYPFRTKCNRQNCGAEKPSHSISHGLTSSEDDQ
ncbi:RanBP2-type zinc finger protein [Musa troglodytarum]|uniref:RanBP2-type zinc finger protein n=1 Tax=Musa troglodytarum TaxID=320322 RepID=A0A9E7HFJ4_9LILI|nr:RanBP2-type zinc finger protein [Musa troglodytarum]URE33595.1 RanBP2-type zinc finger protein [Musa troglodytarum]URE33599.1 RanBP2-type zinc finger protein [Musa troglodytarum]URE33600.1 RanBP2-type zinc finger protein [Musa troglodytarum]URE33603.1 RanBP2-type zinc finger protein [Musa troglodytarum]